VDTVFSDAEPRLAFREASLGAKRRWTRWIWAAGWLVSGALTAVAVVRLSGSTRWPLLIGIEGIAPVLLLLAWPLAIVSAWRKRFILAGLCALLGLAQLIWILPDFGTAGVRQAPAGSFPIHVITANLLTDNHRILELAQDLRRSRADILVLQEFSPANATGCKQSGLLAAYPYHFLDPLPGVHGSAILSRFPLQSPRVIYLDGWPMSEANVRTPAGLVRLVNVHAVAPLSASQIRRWKAQLSLLGDLSASTAGGRIVLAGDFNATLQHDSLRALLANGLGDAFLAAGEGYGATYPSDFPITPLLRLDHVLLGKGLAAVSVQTRRDIGSDHLGLVADIALLRTGVPS
jgi:endonuclease/exonuclease/phosphatase (EEP) superfamily protein YafD